MRPSTDSQDFGTFKRALAPFVVIALLSPTPSVIAQNAAATPSITAPASEVNNAGYSLKPKGLSITDWPNLQLDFSIERSDQTRFRNLSLADVQTKVDGRPLPATEGDLRLRENEASTVLVLLD